MRTPPRRTGRPSNRERAEREGEPGEVLRALSDATRRKILLLLAEKPLAVHEPARHFPVSRPMVSKHPRALAAARLVAGVAVGRERVHRVSSNPHAVHALEVLAIDRRHEEAFRRLREHLARDP